MPRPLNEQVVVLTGASSGIGRATALEFARHGAALVLAARDQAALHEVASEVESLGGRAHVVMTDVSNWAEVDQLANETVGRFGRIDTWVNDAAIAIYARLEDTTLDEFQQLLQVNVMGVLHGVKAALPIMKQQGEGTIINIGSVESEVALPYHSAYSATKHAVKALTDVLRQELQHEDAGINVTLIMPAGINTPFFEHARSKLGELPMPMPPAYPPELVAKAIVTAARTRKRSMYVGGAGKMFAVMDHLLPGITERLMGSSGLMMRGQRSGRPDDLTDNLDETMPYSNRVHGDWDAITKKSLYTPAIEFTPSWVKLATAAAVAGVIGYLGVRRSKRA